MSTKPSILLTGATGFVGNAVLNCLSNYEVKVIGRNKPTRITNINFFETDLHSCENIGNALNNIEIIVHAAARVHVMNDQSTDPLPGYRKINTYGTLKLAQQAAQSGVKRFIFISSIKVSGENTQVGKPFKHSDIPSPRDAYGISKCEAEEGLKIIAAETGMEVVIIRPTLVYGPEVKANFLNMMKWLYKGVPLPLGAIHNKRSFVALDNLVDLIITCINHPKAANETFLASDDRDVSTTELLQLLGTALGKKPLLLPIPMFAIKIFASILGKSDFANRLCGSLQVDISHTKNVLGWKPPVSIETALKNTADSYIQSLN